jgi:hypothetical protein
METFFNTTYNPIAWNYTADCSALHAVITTVTKYNKNGGANQHKLFKLISKRNDDTQHRI